MEQKHQHSIPPQPERRDFFKHAVTVVISAVTTLIPAGAGLALLLDPVRRKSDASQFLKVAKIKDVEKIGMPMRFPVIATRTDVWNKIPDARIGAVYIMKTGPKPDDLVAFNVSCPHLGCAVEFRETELPPVPEQKADMSKGHYFCPCHNSSFALNGDIVDKDHSPAKRGMDLLKVKVEGENILVEFKNFEADRAEKVPVS